LRESGADIAISGRDRARLADLAEQLGVAEPVRPARVHEPRTLLEAMDGCRVVVNCAGPYSRIGEPVVRAAIDAGVHYLDLAGEQAFIREIYERYDSLARRKAIAVVPACGFDIAVGDWAGALAARAVRSDAGAEDHDAEDDDESPLDELIVGYALAGLRTSRGTQLSAIEALARGGSVWRLDRWEPSAPGAESRVIAFPDPFGEREALSFPSGEVITLPRHSLARFTQTYLSLSGDTSVTRWINRLAKVASPALPVLIGSPLGALARARFGGAATALSERERSSAQFAIVAEASWRFRRARVEVCGFDPYAQTAAIAVHVARHLATRIDGPIGVVTPTEVIDPERGLAALDVQCHTVGMEYPDRV
jgi:short subunit dehydrogenase-like uncharacterized protein